MQNSSRERKHKIVDQAQYLGLFEEKIDIVGQYFWCQKSLSRTDVARPQRLQIAETPTMIPFRVHRRDGSAVQGRGQYTCVLTSDPRLLLLSVWGQEINRLAHTFFTKKMIRIKKRY